MTDSEVEEMRDQIARELDTDPMDGGITIPDAGDGITRYPQDGAGGMVPADDIAKYDGEAPPGDDKGCLLYTSPSPRDPKISRMPSSA